ncbi:hypothetical protein C2845_PM12G13290 [Panicum miliaceum]|uniref:Uncharacterized protein n=1 Tax=Panicum miliaceum TaxID=4540 RepID=A0A3L6QLK8_PANMI|nr:hypothetical protein C2845_PM12G13290 [Panicum miliaceum]
MKAMKEGITAITAMVPPSVFNNPIPHEIVIDFEDLHRLYRLQHMDVNLITVFCMMQWLEEEKTHKHKVAYLDPARIHQTEHSFKMTEQMPTIPKTNCRLEQKDIDNICADIARFKNNGKNFEIHLRTTDQHEEERFASTKTRGPSSAGRIVRKNRDIMQFLSKPASSQVNGFVEAGPKRPTVLDLFLKSLQDKNDWEVLCKKFFKLGDDEILALLLEKQGRTKVQLDTNYAELLILHWALAKKAGEWKDGTAGGKGTAKAFLETIADLEEDAQRSLMHRFNIAADLVEQAKDAGKFGLSGLLVWMRFMATTQLTWNKNYNVKPREISQAQDRFTDLLQNLYKSYPQYMSAVGRGGEGDVGQRIRDEILRNNNCMGGMMEEWHQKLHNNTSPDDVVICLALMDYLNSDLDIKVYWDTLNKNGITKERLLNYDHPIHSEPNLKSDQKAGLLHDFANYMRSLKAVHSGADLESAIGTCTGYRTEGEGFMVGVKVNPVNGLPSGYQELLKFVLDHLEDKSVEALVEGLLEARAEVRPLLCGSQERLKDLIFLDIALDSTVRIAVERSYEQLKNAASEKIMYFISLVLENLALSTEDNEDLLCFLKGWNHALSMAKNSDDQWALYAKAHLDRTRLALVTKGEEYHQILQPSAEYLGSLLGVEQWTVNIFTEEIIRSGSAASLSLLLNRLDPVLRNIANLGSWQIISPVEVIGYVTVVDELLTVQNKSYDKPTVLVAYSVKGEEEIPDGVVAVLTPDMPDVLSHVSVRARNSKVLFATCFDPEILSELQRNDGKLISVKPSTTDISYRETAECELLDANSPTAEDNKSGPSISLAKKQFPGKYAICADEFSDEMDVAQNVRHLKEKLSHGEFSALQEIRHALLELVAPTELVWASKWNERAYFSTRKVKLDHAYLSMAVLVQEIVSADYAFVIHTINPSSGDRSEIYAEVVKGLGETLVGAYPGRALSFVCNKDDLNSPKVSGYPSKPIGLFIKQSIIFRSDSNGEDLEGYAGAGLYDIVPVDMEEVVLDYTTDRLITDYSFRNTILSTIAHTGYAIEDLFGSPQDIEGVVKDGKISVVQTRPQM